jgi:hypothetical protein
LRHAACGPRQGATAGRRPRCRGCWWWPSLARVLLRKWASADPSPPLPDRATLATVATVRGKSRRRLARQVPRDLRASLRSLAFRL